MHGHDVWPDQVFPGEGQAAHITGEGQGRHRAQGGHQLPVTVEVVSLGREFLAIGLNMN